MIVRSKSTTSLEVSFIDVDSPKNEEFNVMYKPRDEDDNSLSTVQLQPTNSLNDSRTIVLLPNLSPNTAYLIKSIVTLTPEPFKSSDPSESATGVTGKKFVYGNQ